MGIGFGSLKHMNDTIRQNREILRKKNKKSLRDRYKEEALKLTSITDNADPEEVRERIRQNIHHSPRTKFLTKAASIASALLILCATVWIIVLLIKPRPVIRPKPVFLVREYPISDGLINRSEYFRSGALAAETLLYEGRKHHESNSWYESGELFRTATYYHDTLLVEMYFLKTGDTTRGFPNADSSVRHISIRDSNTNKLISFDLIDGKIVEKSYTESLDISQ